MPDFEPATLASPLELASGLITGEADVRLPSEPPGTSARDALEDVIAESLGSPPTFISFSGGRDSSAILALAVQVARMRGLALPTPLILRAPDVEGADENQWQERVLEHLGLRHPEVLSVGSELELIGPLATEILQGQGVLWPANVVGEVPLLRHARGGTLVTGFDGDGLFGGWRWRDWGDLLRGQRKPQKRDLSRVAYASLPFIARVPFESRKQNLSLPWLRPGAQRDSLRAEAREAASEPLRWDRRVAWWRKRRLLAVATTSMGRLAQREGTHIVHPLMHPRFVAAIAAEGGRGGLGTRTDAMRHLFGDLLPDEVLSRTTKANLAGIWWGNETKRFIRNWRSGGVDTHLVDEEELRRNWLSEEPSQMTGSLVQQAWLHHLGNGVS